MIDQQLPAEQQAAAIGQIKQVARSAAHVQHPGAAAMGQMPNSPFSRDADRVLGKSLQWWAFLLLFIGFAIKVPFVPLHTWLPDAHVEAPTPISMILAGVLLKMGGYGIMRICYPICPDAGYDLAYFVCGVGVVSMVYGAFAAMAQKDFKRLVAYSSVSHMGYVMLGIGVWSATAELEIQSRLLDDGHERGDVPDDRPRHQLGRHVLYGRRDLRPRASSQPGPVRRPVRQMPLYTGLAIGIFFAGLGLPGLCGFIGEVLVTLSVWNFSHTLAVIAASVVILTAGYILWTIQRVYLGPEYKGPHGDHLYPITPRELAIAAPLLALAIVFGVYPQVLFNYMTPTIKQAGRRRWPRGRRM